MGMQLRQRKGSVMVALVILLPIITIATILLADIGHLILAGNKLRITSQRAAFAGAGSMANSLNEIAYKNWEIAEGFRNLKKDFDNDSQKDKNTAEGELSKLQTKDGLLMDEISEINSQMWVRASMIAASVAKRNISSATFESIPLSEEGTQATIANSLTSDQNQKLKYAYVTGMVFDPDKFNTSGGMALQYLAAIPQPDVRFVGRSKITLSNFFVLDKISGPIDLKVMSAAQPYGGSIAQFALTDADNIEDAKSVAGKWLYKVTDIPLEALEYQ